MKKWGEKEGRQEVRKMTKRIGFLLLAMAIAGGLILLGDHRGLPGMAYAATREAKDTRGFTTDFMPGECNGFSATGRNPFFILEPGYQLVLEGLEGKALVNLTITVLGQTQLADGVTTRVVEERETHDGELVEVSRNYFAICNRNNSVFYFGEDVNNYEGGEIINHDGSWLAGVSGAKAGIIMPGVILLGGMYFQEIAPGVAMDRAEIISMSEVVDTPADTFENCLKTFETTPLDRRSKGFKFYAPGIGLVQDGELKLIDYGVVP